MADRFRITNTTIKPRRTDSKGQDMRSLRERRGFSVSFPDPESKNREQRIILTPGRSRSISQLCDGLLEFQAKGHVKIEVVDVSSQLKAFSTPPIKKESSRKEEPKMEEVTKEEPKMAKASPMGEEHTGDKLVNPDGDPNFVAKAPKGGFKKKKGKNKEDNLGLDLDSNDESEEIND